MYDDSLTNSSKTINGYYSKRYNSYNNSNTYYVSNDQPYTSNKDNSYFSLRDTSKSWIEVINNYNGKDTVSYSTDYLTADSGVGTSHSLKVEVREHFDNAIKTAYLLDTNVNIISSKDQTIKFTLNCLIENTAADVSVGLYKVGATDIEIDLN